MHMSIKIFKSLKRRKERVSGEKIYKNKGCRENKKNKFLESHLSPSVVLIVLPRHHQLLLSHGAAAPQILGELPGAPVGHHHQTLREALRREHPDPEPVWEEEGEYGTQITGMRSWARADLRWDKGSRMTIPLTKDEYLV